MNRKRFQLPLRKLVALFTLACALALPSMSRAAVTLLPPDFSEDRWSIMGYKGGAVVDPVELQGHQWLRINRTGAGTDNNIDNSAQVIYNGGFTNVSGLPVAHESNQYGDMTGRVIVGSSSWATVDRAVGLTLRAAGTAFSNQNAYYLAVNREGLGLYWGVGSEFLGEKYRLALAPLGSGLSMATLNASADNQYLIEFSFIGNHLTASLWKLDAEGLPTGTAMASLDYFDTRTEYRETGFFGIRSARWSGNTTGYFRGLEVQAIPEPSTAGLVLMMGAAAGCWWMRSRRKA